MACRSSDAPFSRPLRVRGRRPPSYDGKDALVWDRECQCLFLSPWAEPCCFSSRRRLMFGLAEVDTGSTSSSSHESNSLLHMHPHVYFKHRCRNMLQEIQWLVVGQYLDRIDFSSLDAPEAGCSFQCLRLCQTHAASRCHLSGCVKSVVGEVGNCLLSGVGSQLSSFLLMCVLSAAAGCHLGRPRAWGDFLQRSTPTHLEGC